jgi:hypothetical protein
MQLSATSLPNSTLPRVIDSRHPGYHSNTLNWTKWRLTYEGGESFRDRYLKEYTKREDHDDFINRRNMTPIPTFAKSAINDIRNAIFQRMRDILRTEGSDNYQRAINGLDLGVDRRGSTMNAFLGMNVLTDLLIMGRVGVFVDNSIVEGATLAEAMNARPYLYAYQIEDIMSWTCAKPDAPSEYQSILLRDTCVDYDLRTYLPLRTFHRYRSMWIDKNTGRVNLQFFNLEGNEINRDGLPSTGPTELELTKIPFVLLDIGDSLLKDACEYQIALLNLVSSDVSYAVKSNFPFYIEQKDLRAVGSHLKQVDTQSGTATTGGQGAADQDLRIGAAQGRAYDAKMNAPAFIHPSAEPLTASMKLQEKLEDDIRKLVNLAVTTVASRTSAESKSMDNQGLESGLSFIGLVLESAERQLAKFWAAYEERAETRRKVAYIKYPDRYSLKTDADRIQEATKLSELMFKVPGREIKREIAKNIVLTLLGGKVSVETIQAITDEIQSAKYLTSDPAVIIQCVQAGLCGEQVGSVALGFQESEYLQARKDHAARIALIAESQQAGGPSQPGKPGSDPASRGVPDLSADPANAGANEKAASRDTTLKDNTQPPVRGAGKPKVT